MCPVISIRYVIVVRALSRGTVLVYLGRLKEAISNFHMAKQLNPSNESVDYWLCLAYQLNKSPHLAYQLPVEMQKRYPKSRRPPGLICSYFNRLEKYEETITKGAVAAKSGLDSALIRYEVGFANYALGDYQSAIKNFEISAIIPGPCLLKAYLLSTCPEKNIRNGKAAKEDLDKWKDSIPESECKGADPDLLNECKDQLICYRQAKPFESKGPPKARVPLQFAEGYVDHFNSGYQLNIELFLKFP